MNCNALKDKNILITGATSGIGKTIAEQFAKEGARLVLVGRREEILHQLQTDFGQDTITIPCDLSKTEDIEKIFTVCRENACKLNGLVHCAGIAEMCGIRMFETEDAMNMMNVNTFSFVELCKRFSAKKNSYDESGIVAISSISSIRNDAGMILYSMSKAALNSAVKTMSKEFLKRKIRVNGILPANVKTDMFVSGEDTFEDFMETALERQPLGIIDTEQVSYLAEFLLEKGYEVHGIVRRASISNTARIDHLIEKNVIKLHDGDLSDSSGLIRLVGEIRPDEIYNLAAQSHVQVSFDAPEYSGDVDALGVLRVLEAVRVCGLTKTCKVYQASTSELYGKVEEVPQKETTPFHPYSPYAVAKQYGFWMVKEYRDAYGMFAVNGILFNHESERRGENFVTRKITLAAGRIAEGLQDHLELGNMDSLRDWGYAKDYVECMWLIMQQEKPEDFVIATGIQHTVRDFTEKAFAANGMTIRWEGTGIEEKGYDAATGKMLVCVNPQWFRPTDVDNLWGDPTKAKTVLGWNPQKTSYEELVEIMAKNDRELAKREKAMKAVL